MKRTIILGLATIMSLGSLASEQELEGIMDVFKVTVDKNEETIVRAIDAKEKDLLEYKITYKNKTDKTFKDVSVVGKIPNTTTFIKDSGISFELIGSLATANFYKPVFSIDNGTTWSKNPKKKIIKNGKIVEVEAEVSDYTMIKWNINKFEPHLEKVFKYRVVVNEEN